jgi:hypothetical protein
MTQNRSHSNWIRPLFGALGIMLLAACSQQEDQMAFADGGDALERVQLDVYKSPTCGCCGLWVEHAEESGFEFQIHHRDNDELTTEKLRRGIGLRYHSCHTAVAADGSVFEGHIPAFLIHQYLAAKPVDSIGLAVPAMPIGSPGMEVGDRLQPYDVFLLKADGSSEIYTRITEFDEQYQ